MKSISLFSVLALLLATPGNTQDAPPPLPDFATPPQARIPTEKETAPVGTSAPVAPPVEPLKEAEEPDSSPVADATAGEPGQAALAAATDSPKGAALPTPLAEANPPKEGDIPPIPGADAKQIHFLQRSNLILAKLLENERAMDPFGLVMDPANAKAAPVLADQYKDVEETPQINSSSLKNALLTLPITGIYPQREVLVLGARTFEVGGQFGMKLQELTIRLRFEGIRNGEIFFKDMETREITSIPFNPRPSEFEPIAKGSKRQPGEGISAMSDLFIAN